MVSQTESNYIAYFYSAQVNDEDPGWWKNTLNYGILIKPLIICVHIQDWLFYSYCFIYFQNLISFEFNYTQHFVPSLTKSLVKQN